jgi:hypothetical protein
VQQEVCNYTNRIRSANRSRSQVYGGFCCKKKHSAIRNLVWWIDAIRFDKIFRDRETCATIDEIDQYGTVRIDFIKIANETSRLLLTLRERNTDSDKKAMRFHKSEIDKIAVPFIDRLLSMGRRHNAMGTMRTRLTRTD